MWCCCTYYVVSCIQYHFIIAVANLLSILFKWHFVLTWLLMVVRGKTSVERHIPPKLLFILCFFSLSLLSFSIFLSKPYFFFFTLFYGLMHGNCWIYFQIWNYVERDAVVFMPFCFILIIGLKKKNHHSQTI